jgi:hypothetical protein
MHRRRPFARAGVVGVALFASAHEALAQAQVPVFLVGEQGEFERNQAQDAEAIARSIGPRALIGPSLSSAVEERFATRAEWQDTLQPVRTRIMRSRRAYHDAVSSQQQGVAEALLISLEQDADALLAQPIALDRSRETREALMSAVLFVADSTIATQPARAAEALRKLASAFPEITLGPRSASTAVRTAFREQVLQVANASLVVQSAPDSCQVRRNGIVMGNAPAQLQSLAAGQHRVSVRCGASDSLVHRVVVGAGTTSTVQVDVTLDRAIRFGDNAGFVYANERVADDRSVSDAAIIANALGAERAVLYRARTRRAIVIDVLARSVLRELEQTQYAQLTEALRGASSTNTPARTPSTPPRVAVRPRLPTPATTPFVSPRPQPVQTAAMTVVGAIFTSTGILFAVSGAAAWAGADYARTQSGLLGRDGFPFTSVSQSVTSVEPPLRALAVGGWIAGGTLLATGVTMIVVGTTRREPGRARVLVTPAMTGVAGVF